MFGLAILHCCYKCLFDVQLCFIYIGGGAGGKGERFARKINGQTQHGG